MSDAQQFAAEPGGTGTPGARSTRIGGRGVPKRIILSVDAYRYLARLQRQRGGSFSTIVNAILLKAPA